MNENYFILLLAGSGSRLYDKIHMKKQFYPLRGKEMFLYPLKSAVESSLFSRIVLVVDEEDRTKVTDILNREFPGNDFKIAVGGKDRNESVGNGLALLKNTAKENAYVFIHDSDRVLLSSSFLRELEEKVRGYDALTPVLDLHDSILKEERDRIEYLDRNGVKLIQTPQVFLYFKIQEIYENGYDKQDTDDFKKAVAAGLRVRTVPGVYENFKVTTIDELSLIQRIFDH